MEIRRGIAVSPGVAIGPALVLDTEGVRIPHRTVPPDQIPAETWRMKPPRTSSLWLTASASPGSSRSVGMKS